MPIYIGLSEAIVAEPTYTVYGKTIHAQPATLDGRCHVQLEKASFIEAYKEDFPKFSETHRWCETCFGREEPGT